jgi:hypothetical protein
MKTQRMKILLDKYYKGETSIDEENILMNYFLDNDVPEEFCEDRKLFVGLNELKEEDIVVPENLKNDILNKLEPLQENKIKKINFSLYKVMSVAASVVLIISTVFLLNRNVDTYDDPQLAYAETKEALYTVSKYFNKMEEAVKPLKNVEKIDETREDLEYLNLFNKGLDLISND